MGIFSVNCIAFQLFSYPLSFIEMIATGFGLISVYLASRSNINTWPTGIVNELGLFILFFQVQLYADMFLQLFFLVATVYGWYCWGRPEEESSVTTMSSHQRLGTTMLWAAGTFLLGFIMMKLHVWLPEIFKTPANSPFVDSAVTVASIIATVLLARKALESWVAWILVDVVSIALFVSRGLMFLTCEYVIFLLLACYGYWQWRHRLV